MKNKYASINDSTAARRAYSIHDGGITPDESPDRLEKLK